MSVFKTHLSEQLQAIRDSGMYKEEREIAGPQGSDIVLRDGSDVLNFCANNYLGLANHPVMRDAAHAAIDDYGYGLSSVRFICGTQTVHHALEQRIARFLKMDDAILFPSCFDANGGLFEALLTAEDAIISDQLNHASLIDGIRLCKAKRYRYKNNDMADLQQQCEAAKENGARFIVIVTDGVFSMDGIIADLPSLCDIAETYGAITVVDDSHATGFVGKHGRGTPEHCGVEGRIDILTGTLGKALGGASGGYIAASKPVVAMLKQRARPYLFSNAVAPPIAAASLAAFDWAEKADDARERLEHNHQRFRTGMRDAGFDCPEGEHAIVPVMFYEEPLAAGIAKELLKEGVYVTAFTYPVVPKGTARIRVQLSALHTDEHIDRVIAAFGAAKKSVEETVS